MKAMVAPDGSIPIPDQLRQRLGIAPGELIDVEAEDGRLILKKVTDRDLLDAASGVIALGMTVDEYMQQLRGDARDVEAN